MPPAGQRTAVASLGLEMSPRRQRALDDELGLTSLSAGAACASCRGPVQFDTDFIGRVIERCTACGAARYPAMPVARPEGDGYTGRESGVVRRERKPRPSPLNDSDIDLLRTTRASRAEAPMDPRLVQAKREFEALLEREKELGKGGRRKNPFHVGRATTPARVPRGRVVITDLADDVSAPPPPPTPKTMPRGTPANGFAQKPCERSGVMFSPTGSRSRYCNTCDECVAAASDTNPAARPTRKPRRPKKDKKRKAIDTGFGRSPRSTRSATTSRYSAAIAGIDAEISALDAKRDELTALRDKLKELEAA